MDYGKTDRLNTYGILKDMPKQIREASKLGTDIKFEGGFDKIFVAGMGGSGLPGAILQTYLGNAFPVYVVRDYSLPSFVNEKSLIFIISYSGDAEETLSMYKQALKTNAKTVIITSGGKLKELAKVQDGHIIKVPSGLPSRMALGYQFFPILNVLVNAKIIKDKSNEIKKTIETLEKPIYEERAKELAAKIAGKIPLIYSSARMAGVAYKWKTDINENSKRHAFYHSLPEMNHNEIVGFTKILGNFYVIFIKDEADDSHIQKRMALTKDIIKGCGVDLTEIAVTGDCYLARIFSAIYIGDFVSHFLAISEAIDPSPSELIELLKEEMARK